MGKSKIEEFILILEKLLERLKHCESENEIKGIIWGMEIISKKIDEINKKGVYRTFYLR